MSRARNRADGDFGDLDITNIGAVSLDSIKGDADGNTSLAFSGSDVITITTGGTTAATFSAAQLLTITDDLVIKSGGTIGGANDTDLLTLGNAALTVAGTLAATTGTFSGILKTDDTTEATSTTDGSLQTDGGLSVVGDAVFGDDVKLLSDASVLSFGADSDVTLTHVADTALLLNSSRQLQFGDSGTHISQSADGVLDLVSDTEIEINATTIDINGNVEISGTTAQVGVATFTARDIHSGGITIANDGQIGSVGDTDAIAISSAGVTTFSQKDVHSIGMSVKNGATSAGFVEFFEDSDNGSNKVTLIGPASTADVTVVLPSAAGTLSTTDDATALAIALG